VCGFEQEASYAHRTTLGQGGLHASELAEVTVGISDFGINGSDDAAETDEIGLVELELGGEVEKDLADVDDQVEGLGLVLAAVAHLERHLAGSQCPPASPAAAPPPEAHPKSTPLPASAVASSPKHAGKLGGWSIHEILHVGIDSGVESQVVRVAKRIFNLQGGKITGSDWLLDH